MRLIILGAPGSGKGTVSEKLVKEFGFVHISTGELLREEGLKNTPEAKKIQQHMQKGELVPTSIIAHLLRNKVKNHDKYILDGFPRSIEQADLINDIKIDAVINLDVPEAEVLKRFAGRRVCPKCNAGYNIDSLPPKKAGICDNCGSNLIQRKDDDPTIVKERFKVYAEQTQPLINYYTEKKMIYNIDASKNPDVVGKKVIALIKKLKD